LHDNRENHFVHFSFTKTSVYNGPMLIGMSGWMEGTGKLSIPEFWFQNWCPVQRKPTNNRQNNLITREE